MPGSKKIKNALISVFHKDGLDNILKKLNDADVTFFSTGGTKEFIEACDYPCVSVESLTGYPSILGGRVKTLHPKVFGGILNRRENESDQQQMVQYDIPEIDLVIAATNTPDMWFPATACIVCDKLGIRNAWGFDLLAACSGFLYGLETVSKFIESGQYRKALFLAGDKMSAIVDYTDRNTCPLFGDAATALLIEPTTEDVGVVDKIFRVDGVGRHHLYMKAGGSQYPSTHETVDNRWHYTYQDGKTVFKYAVLHMADAAIELMERNHISPEELAYLVPHQANLRIIDAVGRRMELDPEKVMVNIEKYGNTTAATIPLCLYDWEHKLKKGDKLILAAFGGGFTWGALYLKWAY